MVRKLVVLLVLASLVFVAGSAHARHPWCLRTHGGGFGGYTGWGGGFYSNTCYAGFNSPWIYGGGCNWGGYGYCAPRVYSNYYYGSCYPAYDTYYYYPNYYPYGAYYTGPVFAPAEDAFGPLAVKRFLGIADRPAALAAHGIRLAEKPVPARLKVRESNPEYRRKAEQFIAQGDMLFREQKYQQAIDRYKTASEMAPDLAEAHWRRGHAYAATNRYELAAASYKRALAIDPDVRREGFSLTTLYGDRVIAKTSQLEALAGYVLDHEDSSDAYFVLGVFLHYDGESERAARFFGRAAELTGVDARHLAGFVPAAKETPAEVPVKATEVEI